MRLFIVDSLRTLAMLLFLLHFQMQNGQYQPIDGNAEAAAECLSSWVMFIASSQSVSPQQAEAQRPIVQVFIFMALQPTLVLLLLLLYLGKQSLLDHDQVHHRQYF